ncbi:MAG: glycosyltransferase family 39 protein [Candidatus Diapherotrites archaeon]|nr:glycosyltransferase family 39 protein [Candidatus Diapherotrites archaeon]
MQSALSWVPYGSTQYNWFLDTFFLRNTVAVTGIVFLALLVLVFLNRKTIREALRFREKRTLWLLAGIFIIGFLLRNASYNNGVPTDGWVFFESAKHIVHDGLFVKNCSVGNLQQCGLYEQVLFPPGYPFLIAIPYLLFGINSLYASVISALFSSLTILLVFLISRELFKNDTIGLYAALIFALFPLDLIFANTGNSRPTSVFFIALTLFFYLLAIRKNNAKIWAMTALSFSYAIYVRQENSVLLLPMIAGLFFLGYFKKPEFAKKKNTEKARLLAELLLPACCIFLLTQLPVQAWILLANPIEPQGLFGLDAAGKRITDSASDMFFANSYSKNLGYGALFNPLISVVFLFSPLLFLQKKQWKELLFVWGILAVFLAIALLYFPQLGPEQTDYVRYTHPLVLPFSVIGGAAIFAITEKLKAGKEIAVPVLCGFLLFFSGIPLQASLFRDARLEEPDNVAFYLEAVQRAPNGCTVISSNYLAVTSDAIPGNERRTLNPWIFNENSKEIYLEEMQKAECLVVLEDSSLREISPELYEELGKFQKERLFAMEKGVRKITAFRLEKKAP